MSRPSRVLAGRAGPSRACRRRRWPSPAALDLDHVGAEVGERLRAPRAGEHARQVEHAHAGERLRRRRAGGRGGAVAGIGHRRIVGASSCAGARDNRCDEPRIRPPGPRASPATLWLPAALVACSPALDWREVRPEGSGVIALFPCRPDKHERPVRIAGAELRMQLHSCDAAGSTFSLAVVDGAEPVRVEPLLVALKASAAANIAGGAPLAEPFAPPGATPNPASALAPCAGPAAGRSPGHRCMPPFSSTAFASTRRRRSARPCPKTPCAASSARSSSRRERPPKGPRPR